MYSFTTHVRYSEVDEHYQLTTSAMMNHLQDVAVAHTQSTSQNLQHLAQVGRAWFVGSWNIEVLRRPQLSDQIVVSTWATKLHGFFANRNFLIATPDGQSLIQAESTWLFVDLATTKPLRPEPQNWEPYHDPADTPLKLAHATQRRLSFNTPAEKHLQLQVQPHMLDSNHHVNNTQYIDLACLASNFENPAHIEVQYKQQAVLHDQLVVAVHPLEDGYGVSIKNSDGATFALVQLEAH